MTRLHLFEFEDQPWCPAVLRSAITGYLRLVAGLTRQERPVVAQLAELLHRTGETTILDLCSGSGGIAPRLADALTACGAPARVVLSDLYPNTDAFREAAANSNGRVGFCETPIDAAAVPASLPGLRTMFNAFHHLRPHEARRVLASAAESGHPIAIAEFIERGPFPLLGVLFSPVLVVLLAPLLRPFRWSTLLFTWLVPVVPLMVFWDGLVSWLRVYSLEDLRAMAASASRPGYVWSAGHWGSLPVRVTYLVGHRA